MSLGSEPNWPTVSSLPAPGGSSPADLTAGPGLGGPSRVRAAPVYPAKCVQQILDSVPLDGGLQ